MPQRDALTALSLTWPMLSLSSVSGLLVLLFPAPRAVKCVGLPFGPLATALQIRNCFIRNLRWSAFDVCRQKRQTGIDRWPPPQAANSHRHLRQVLQERCLALGTRLCGSS